MRKVLSFIILLIILFQIFKSDITIPTLISPFLTDGVSTHKDYRDFAQKNEFSSICWIKCGGAVFSGGIIGYKGDNAIILTTGHGFDSIVRSLIGEPLPKELSSTVSLTTNTCVMGFDAIVSGEKNFAVTHVILNPTYLRLCAEDSSAAKAYDYALVVAHIPQKHQNIHPPISLPPSSPFKKITPAQFCGYGTADKKKRALGLFGGEHEPIFPNLHKANLTFPFFDPKGSMLEDELVRQWHALDKIPTGRAEPGDSGSPILIQKEDGSFFTVGVIQGIQFQGDPKGLKTAKLKEQFENISTIVAPIVVLKKDGLYHISKTFDEMMGKALQLIN